MEQNEAADAEDDVPNDHEGAVLTELAVGGVNHEADDGVGNAVPQTHDHGEGRCQHHANADETHQGEGQVVHQEHVQVGCGVVQCEAANSPQRNAVNAVFAQELGANGLTHRIFSLLSFFSRLPRCHRARTPTKESSGHSYIG